MKPAYTPVLAQIFCIFVTGCGNLDPETACATARWRLADHAQRGSIRDVEMLDCVGPTVTGERATITLNARYSEAPKAKSYTWNQPWKPRSEHDFDVVFVYGADGWTVEGGDPLWQPSGKRGPIDVVVKFEPEDGTPAPAGGSCEVVQSYPSPVASAERGSDGRCHFPDVGSGDVLVLRADVPGYRSLLTAFTVDDVWLEGKRVATLKAMRHPVISMEPRDALSGDALADAQVSLGGTPLVANADAAFLSVPIVPEGPVEWSVSAPGHIARTGSTMPHKPPPYVWPVQVDLLPEGISGEVVVSAVSGRPATVSSVVLTESIGVLTQCDVFAPKVHLDAKPAQERIVATVSRRVHLDGPVDTGIGLRAAQHRPGVCPPGHDYADVFTRELTGWIAFPVAIWSGGELPDPVVTDVPWPKVKLPAGIVVGASALAKSPGAPMLSATHETQPLMAVFDVPDTYELPGLGLWAVTRDLRTVHLVLVVDESGVFPTRITGERR